MTSQGVACEDDAAGRCGKIEEGLGLENGVPGGMGAPPAGRARRAGRPQGGQCAAEAGVLRVEEQRARSHQLQEGRACAREAVRVQHLLRQT